MNKVVLVSLYWVYLFVRVNGSKLGVSFSPAGLLTPFHLGVAEELRRIGVLSPETTVAGSSGGALAAVCSALEIPSETSLAGCCEVARMCRDRGTFRNLRVALDQVLDNVLSESSHHILENRPAPTFLAFTEVYPKIRGQVISKFTSREDLIEVIRASCTIPVYFSGYPAVKVRESYGLDGFFAVERNRFGCPSTYAKKLEIIVCPFDPTSIGLNPIPGANQEVAIISPNLLNKSEWTLTTSQLVSLALGPPRLNASSPELITDQDIEDAYYYLYKSGQNAARNWSKSMILS